MLKPVRLCILNSALLREGPFSLERGLNTVYVFFKLSIILCSSSRKICPTNKKGDPVGVALARAAMRLDG